MSKMSEQRRIDELLSHAKDGDTGAIGTLLEVHRGYLTLLAQVRFDDRLKSRLSPSDIVQETMMDAYRDFERFRGTSDSEFRGWIRQILIHNLASVVEKHVLAAKRDVRRQVSLRQRLDNSVNQSASGLEAFLADPEASVVGNICHQEQLTQLADALTELPEDYREVIVQRHLEGKSFNEVAESMGRTSSATRMLWLRAVSKLRKTMEHDRS